MQWIYYVRFCNKSEGQENILSKDENVQNGISLQNEQHLEANISLNKTVPLESVTATLEPVTDKNNLKSAEVLIKQSSVQSSTVIPNHSTVTLSSANVLIRTNETSEKILHTTMKSAVMYSPVKSTSTSHSAGKWVVVSETDEICIIVQMSVMFNISYINDNNTKSFIVFDVPTDNVTTKANGSCGELEQTLTLEWASKNITNGSMTLHFMKNVDGYSLHHLEVILPPTDFPATTLNTSMTLIHKAHDFVVKLSNSYRCLKQQMLNLKQNNTNETLGYLTVSGFQFQAFKVDNSTVFGLAKDCAFDTPDVVPIAVGCALAGLVIIVLIAYLIGRHRNQAHGYLSM
ncbi:hypothetical protein E2986_07734 [Frieseomelitta varia]|uniref:Lysosome-associated membrane glycoprotein 5 n=1 Tax=Frieseomelitta varia TaxID=561572 RepID=A0A833S526_9HYME|nr:hypothetical protein E2986_07734 [Frieseomelitta varia]